MCILNSLFLTKVSNKNCEYMCNISLCICRYLPIFVIMSFWGSFLTATSFKGRRTKKRLFSSCFLLYFFITIYPHYTLFNLHPHLSPEISTQLSMSMSFFSLVFAWSLHLTQPPELSACSLSSNLSLIYLLVWFVH